MAIRLWKTLGYTQGRNPLCKTMLIWTKWDFKTQLTVCLCLTLYFRVALYKDYSLPFSQSLCPLDAVIFVLGSLNKILTGYRLQLPLKVTSSIVIMCDNVTVSSLSKLSPKIERQDLTYLAWVRHHCTVVLTALARKPRSGARSICSLLKELII